MDALAILGAAASAVLQVLVLASAGAYLEIIGLLGPVRRRVLSDVAFRILLPCLLFTSVCESASIEALTKQYSLPLFMILYVVLGYLMGWFLSFYTTQPDDEFSSTHFIFSCALNNVGYLPLILVPATILQGALHPNGSDLSIEVKRGVSCVGLCILVMNVCTWSLAATSLRKVAKRKLAKEEEQQHHQAQSTVELSNHQDKSPTGGSSTSSSSLSSSSPSTGHKVKGLDTEVRDKYYALFLRYSVPTVIASFLANTIDFLVSVINPPVAGALSGLVIGLISPLRALFFASKPLGLLASSSSGGSGNTKDPHPINTVVPNIATLFGMDMHDTHVLNALQACPSTNPIVHTMTMFVRNTTGWFLCSMTDTLATVTATPSTVGSIVSCCVSLPLISEVISVTDAQDSHSLLTMIGTNITSDILYSAGMSDSLIDMVNSAAVSAAAIEGINLNNQINTGLAAASNGPKVAPLQPFITSSMQSFASAIIPIVAITLGSNIVAKDTKNSTTAKIESTPHNSSVSLPSTTTSISVSSTPTTTDTDTDLQVMPPPAASKLGHYLQIFVQKMKLTLLILWKIAIGKDPIDDSQVVRTRVLGGIIFSRMIFMPLVGIILSYFGSKLGIVPGNDRTLVFVLLVEAATPTAMNLQLISDIMGSGSRAMARVIAVTYVLSVVSLTVWISIALALIRNGVFEN